MICEISLETEYRIILSHYMLPINALFHQVQILGYPSQKTRQKQISTSILLYNLKRNLLFGIC